MGLVISNTAETFDSWLDKDFIDEKLKGMLSKSSILIVPFENLRDTKNPLMFPICTEEVLRYFREKLQNEQLIDICISDELYQEFAFYSDYKRIGNFIVKSFAIPVFVSVLATYIYDKYLNEDNTKPKIEIIDSSTHTTTNNHISILSDKKYLEPTHIKFSVTIVDTAGSSKKISYEGPATEFDTVLKTLKKYEE